jgi:hypothetical protein
MQSAVYTFENVQLTLHVTSKPSLRSKSRPQVVPPSSVGHRENSDSNSRKSSSDEHIPELDQGAIENQSDPKPCSKGNQVLPLSGVTTFHSYLLFPVLTISYHFSGKARPTNLSTSREDCTAKASSSAAASKSSGETSSMFSPSRMRGNRTFPVDPKFSPGTVPNEPKLLTRK